MGDITYLSSDCWYLAPKKDKEDPDGKALAQAIRRIATERETAAMPKRWRSYVYARLMSGRPHIAQFAFGMARRPDTFLNHYGAAEFSPMKAGFAGMIDDVFANKLFAHPTFVEYVPDFDEFSQRQLAEDQTTWIDEQFEATRFWEAWDAMGMDARWYGDGWLKFGGSKLSKKLTVEAVNPDELLFSNDSDPRPNELIQRVWTTKTKEIAKFKKDKKAVQAILDCPPAYPAFWFGPGNLNTTNVICLTEAWISPDPEDKEDKGRHALTVGDYAIIDEDWEEPTPPFEKWCFHEMPSSVHGQGLAEILLPYSEWIDQLLNVMIEADEACGTPKLLVEENSNVNPDAFGDIGAGNVVSYAGAKPEILAPESLGQWANQRLQMVREMGMQRVHVSLNSVQGEIPKGLEAAVAIERYAQIDDASYARDILRLEAVVTRAARWLLRFGKRIKPTFTMPGRKTPIIDWDKLDPESAQLKGYNVGKLGQTIAGRTQQLKSMAADGDIPRQVFNRYLQIPVIDGRGGMMDLINAPTEGVSRILSKLVLGKAYVPPSPYLDLDWAKQAVEAQLILEEDWGTPEPVLDRLRMWRAAVIELIGQRDNPQAPANDNGAPSSAPAAAAPVTGVQLPDSAPGAPVGTDQGVPGKPIPTGGEAA